jgi:hypothetical protein
LAYHLRTGLVADGLAGVWVEVTDCGGDGVPVLGPAACEAEGSRGLHLVEALARPKLL